MMRAAFVFLIGVLVATVINVWIESTENSAEEYLPGQVCSATITGQVFCNEMPEYQQRTP